MSGVPGPNVIRTCKCCGESYHPKSTRQQCCNKPIKVPCAVCGKLMDQICTFSKQNITCSKTCSTSLANQSRESTAQQQTRTCKWCGKEFHPKTVRDFYCEGPHYAICEVCGKQFEITGRIDTHNKTCSEKCRYLSAKRNTDTQAMQAALKATMLKRYGVENAMQIPGTVDKIKATTKERYGTEWYTQTDEYRRSVKTTSLSKYGTTHPLASKVVQAKRADTIKKRYGVSNVFQDACVKEQVKATNLAKYGVEYISQSPEIHRRMYTNRINNVATDGAVFDSSYERDFYNFLLTLDDVSIQTQVPLEYVHDGIKHTTLIDFKVNDTFYEVKGSHLLTGVFSSEANVPIDVKLSVYRDNHVVLITDTINNVAPIFAAGLIGVDVTFFTQNNTNSREVWQQIMDHISSGQGFLLN